MIAEPFGFVFGEARSLMAMRDHGGKTRYEPRIRAVDRCLRRILTDIHPFWIVWGARLEDWWPALRPAVGSAGEALSPKGLVAARSGASEASVNQAGAADGGLDGWIQSNCAIDAVTDCEAWYLLQESLRVARATHDRAFERLVSGLWSKSASPIGQFDVAAVQAYRQRQPYWKRYRHIYTSLRDPDPITGLVSLAHR